MNTLVDKVVVITGAASGIGRASAEAVARRGANVVVVDRDTVAATAVVDGIADAGGTALVHTADVADQDAFTTLRDRTIGEFGRVDVVMNNVGVLTNGLPENIPVTEWQRIIEINLLSVVRSNTAFLPDLIGQGDGHIVNTASFAGLFTYSFDRMPYAATKAAIVAMTEGLAIYLRPKGIGVTLLCPGPVLTNIANQLPQFGPATPLCIPGDQFELLDPTPVGELVVDAILQNRFFVPTHPQVGDVLVQRASDWDGFIDYQAHRHPL